MMKNSHLVTAILIIFMYSYASADIVATFDSKDTGEDGYYLPDTEGSHDWTDAGMTFNLDVDVDPDWGTSWSGFTYSNVDNPNEGGYENQYAVYKPGTDFSGDGVYAVGFVDSYNEVYPTATFDSPTQPQGLYVNNSAYAAHTIRDGDQFTDAFEEGDWFRLTITGQDSAENEIGSVNFDLADFEGYEDGDEKDDYMVSEWAWVDLTGLGDNVASLQFDLSSSDTGVNGMNTPAYFAADNVTTIPEPSALMLLVGFSVISLVMRRRCW